MNTTLEDAVCCVIVHDLHKTAACHVATIHLLVPGADCWILLGLFLVLIACVPEQSMHSAMADCLGTCVQTEISSCQPRRLLTMAL